MTEIINISNILEKIGMKGYPRDIAIIIDVKAKLSFSEKEVIKVDDQKEFIYCEEKTFKSNYKEIINKLKNILVTLKECQMDAYIKRPLIRYIYGRQFSLFYSFFDNKSINQKNIIPILNYITRNLYQNEVNHDKYKVKEENDDIISTNINNCENYLNEVLKINKLSLEKIYKTTLINTKKLNKNIGVF